MSCYTRHLGDWLPPEPTWLDRRALDEAVRAELGKEAAASGTGSRPDERGER